MSSFGFADDSSWGGRPVAIQVSEARSRSRALITGVVRKTETAPLGASTAFECTLDDDTGEIVLVFVGRNTVPGFAAGLRCVAEGTVREVGGRLEIWNPRYRLISDD